MREQSAQVRFALIIGHPKCSESLEIGIQPFPYKPSKRPRHSKVQLVSNKCTRHTVVIKPIPIVAAYLMDVLLFNDAFQPPMFGTHNPAQSQQLLYQMRSNWAVCWIRNGIVGDVGEQLQLRIPRLEPGCASAVRRKYHFVPGCQPTVNERCTPRGMTKPPVERG